MRERKKGADNKAILMKQTLAEHLQRKVDETIKVLYDIKVFAT